MNKDQKRNELSNQLGAASAHLADAMAALDKAHAMRRGNPRLRIGAINRDISEQMKFISKELDELDGPGCPF